MEPNPSVHERPGRWAMLAAYTLVVGVTQLLWLNFAPLGTYVQERYGVSELSASLLVLVFPLLYVVLSLHAGSSIDRYGYRSVVGAGAIWTAVFALLRIYDESFWVLLPAQVGIAMAQPYVQNAVPKLVCEWFGPRHAAVATGITTMGMFLGMALGMGVTPMLVARTSLAAAMAIFAGIAVIAALWFVWSARKFPLREAERSALSGTPSSYRLRPQLWLLFGLSFLGLGFFNGLTTWLERILAPRGVSAEQAGWTGAALILGGVLGAIGIPALSDYLRRRKPILLMCTGVAVLMVPPLCASGDLAVLLTLASLLGFFFLPAYALLLEICGELSGVEAAGQATGVLMLSGNVGGVAVILAIQFVRGDGASSTPAVGLLVGLLISALFLSAFLAETHPARAPKVAS